MKLAVIMRDFFIRHGLDRNYIIAYSGGLDSHVLLSLCFSIRKIIPIKLSAIYVNHRLSVNADKWAKHCAEICDDYAIPYIEKRANLDLTRGESLEEKAREKRYETLSHSIHEHDMLLTAHHQDDQAETFLLQLLRGAGPMGLSAMPAIKTFGRGLHARPLLDISRADLREYADENKLNWIEDESNLNTKMTRNFIRHDVLPLLKIRWPSVSKMIARSAAHCAEAQSVIDEFTSDIFRQTKGSHVGALSVTKLLLLEDVQQKNVIRLWIKKLGYPLPNTKKLSAIQSDVLHASRDAQPCVRWGAVVLRRYRDDLFLMKSFAPPLKKAYDWDFSAPLCLPEIGTLCAISTRGSGLRTDLTSVSVRFRQGGEVVNLEKRGRHTLKNVFQEWGVAPWLRDRIPLIFVEEKLVCVLGYFMDDEVTVKESHHGLMLELR